MTRLLHWCIYVLVTLMILRSFFICSIFSTLSLWAEYGFLKENESLFLQKGEVFSVLGFSGDSDSDFAFILTFEDQSDAFFPLDVLGNEMALSVVGESGAVRVEDLAKIATDMVRKKGLKNTRFERRMALSGALKFVRIDQGKVTGEFSEKQLRESIQASNINSQRIVGPCTIKNKMTYLSYKLERTN